jgi:isoquinoline 1-oxidoreductase beta subunit
MQANKQTVIEKISRRSILQGLGVTAGLVLATPVLSRRSMAYTTGAGAMPHGTVNDPRVFVSIAPDGLSPSSRTAPKWAPARAPACR